MCSSRLERTQREIIEFAAAHFNGKEKAQFAATHLKIKILQQLILTKTEVRKFTAA